jgi:hypothetical protein
MSHNLFAVFPLPVLLALAALVLLLLAMLRVLADMCKPVPVRNPAPDTRQPTALAEPDPQHA